MFGKQFLRRFEPSVPPKLIHRLYPDVSHLHLKSGFESRRRLFLGKTKYRILYHVLWKGGVGGVERSSQAFAGHFLEQGCLVDMVYERELPPGPYSINERKGLRLFSLEQFKKEPSPAEYDLFYSQPYAEFDAAFWKKKLSSFQGLKITNWQSDSDSWLAANDFEFDLIHFESFTAGSSIPSGFVCPAPESTSLPPEIQLDLPFPRYFLTVFNPYGTVKGLDRMKKALDHLDRPLVWCYDLSSFAYPPERLQSMQNNLAGLYHPNLHRVEAPAPAYLAQLYRQCDAYFCFSEYESYGWAIRDAIYHGKPVCSRQVGVLRQARNFNAWSNVRNPVFNEMTNSIPADDFFQNLRNVLQGRAVSPYRFEAVPVTLDQV